MGTSIELSVGAVALSSAKNHMGVDWGHLFQEADLVRSAPEDVDGLEDGAAADLGGEADEAFVRPLAAVAPRLELLGWSLDRAREEYRAALDEAAELRFGEDGPRPAPLDFDGLRRLVCAIPVPDLAEDFVADRSDEEARGRLGELSDGFERLPWTEGEDFYWSEASYLSARTRFLSPESTLLLLATDPRNAEAEVSWRFGPIVRAGWVGRGCFRAGAAREQAVLVATEGSSDAHILRRAFDVLRPDVADFFRFIDGDERHHFWGTGNLVRFAEGLVRIDVQNRVLFLLDNDAEGVDAFRRLRALGLPGNMQAMVLPDAPAFEAFPALGPDGERLCDVNGRAAAIECYLDLDLPGRPPPRVVWSNYKKELDRWQGALEHKESYSRRFLDLDAEELRGPAYDASRLLGVLDAVIGEVSRGSRAA